MKKIALLVLFMAMIASLAGYKEKKLKPDDTIGEMKLFSFC